MWPSKRERCLIQLKEFEQLAQQAPRTANLTIGDNFLAHNAAVERLFTANRTTPFWLKLNLFVDEWAPGHFKQDHDPAGPVEESEIARVIAEKLCEHPLRAQSHAVDVLCQQKEKSRANVALQSAYKNMKMVQRPAGSKGTTAIQPEP